MSQTGAMHGSRNLPSRLPSRGNNRGGGHSGGCAGGALGRVVGRRPGLLSWWSLSSTSAHSQCYPTPSRLFARSETFMYLIEIDYHFGDTHATRGFVFVHVVRKETLLRLIKGSAHY